MIRNGLPLLLSLLSKVLGRFLRRPTKVVPRRQHDNFRNEKMRRDRPGVRAVPQGPGPLCGAGALRLISFVSSGRLGELFALEGRANPPRRCLRVLLGGKHPSHGHRGDSLGGPRRAAVSDSPGAQVAPAPAATAEADRRQKVLGRPRRDVLQHQQHHYSGAEASCCSCLLAASVLCYCTPPRGNLGCGY